MSNTTSKATPRRPDPFDAFVEDQRKVDLRNAEGKVVEAERDRIWQELLADPIGKFIPRWFEACKRFGESLASGRTQEAARDFLSINSLLIELQAIWKTWSEARERWFRTHAKAFHDRHPDGGKFGLLNVDHEPQWLFYWVRDACDGTGPIQTPGKVSWKIYNNTPEFVRNLPMNSQAIEAVTSFGKLGRSELSIDKIEADLNCLKNPKTVAALWPILSNLIVPGEEALKSFLFATPSVDLVRAADWIMGNAACIGGGSYQRLKEFAQRKKAEDHLAAVLSTIHQGSVESETQPITPPVSQSENGINHHQGLIQYEVPLWLNNPKSRKLKRIKILKLLWNREWVDGEEIKKVCFHAFTRENTIERRVWEARAVLSENAPEKTITTEKDNGVFKCRIVPV